MQATPVNAPVKPDHPDPAGASAKNAPQRPGPGGTADLAVHPVPLAGLDEAGLLALSRRGGLALDGPEMAAIQRHFQALGRAPTQMELETLAQTWSEHCKHKTLTGRVRFE